MSPSESVAADGTDGRAGAVSPPGAVRLGVCFARVARGLGLGVPTGSVLTLCRALAATGVSREADVYWAGRVTMVRSAEEIPAYDAAFGAFWRGSSVVAAPATPPERLALRVEDPDAPESERGPGDAVRALVTRYSAEEVLSHRDFATMSEAELAESYRLIGLIAVRPPSRRGGRRVRARRGDRPDVRRAVRQSIKAGGEAVRWPAVGREPRQRRIVLLCDVSGSMEPYARALLRLAQATVSSSGRADAFAIGTRLTRLTRELSSRDPDAALAAAASAVRDWSGGTRIGECLAAFNGRFGARGMARGAIVVVLSDGWDRGDAGLLGAEMRRLSRMAKRVVWVNPLKATAGYAPLAGGMAAALPYVDEFVEGHTLQSLIELAEVIAR